MLHIVHVEVILLIVHFHFSPLMITTQKLTTLAFSVSDWNLFYKRGCKMDEERQKWAVR